MAVLALMLCVVSSTAAVREVGPIELTVNDLDRELQFFTNTFPFQTIAITQWDKGTVDGQGRHEFDARFVFMPAALALFGLLASDRNPSLQAGLSPEL